MSSPFDAHNIGGSQDTSSMGEGKLSAKAQLKGLPGHLKSHDFDIKQMRKRDIRMGRQNITETLQQQNRVTEATQTKQKMGALQQEMRMP
jgi:hypothetical protein